jgi:hypothetical protein
MMERVYWLKSVGSKDDLQADDWPDSAPQELSYVHFPEKGKPSVTTGDYLVYYASGRERIIGIAEVYSQPTKDSGETRWPWRCEVRPHIIINRIQRCPSLDEMSGPEREFRLSVRQQSHVQISEVQFLRARKALEGVFDLDEGDRYSKWPMFETALRGQR